MTTTQPYKIGLVVAKPFSYSETFYSSDVRIWQELGYEVHIFPIQRNNEISPAKTSYHLPPIPLSQNPLKRLSQIIRTAFRLLFSISKVLRFIRFERQDNISLRQLLARIYANQHLLVCKSLDVIVFGYGNLAVTRENLGHSHKAQTVVSFKGFDISIYPYQYHKAVFNKVFAYDFLFYFVSEGLHEKAKAIGFPYNKKVKYIPAYIDEATMPSPKESWENNTPTEILVVGRLHWIKAHIYLIMALGILHKDGHQIKLTFIGDGAMYEQLFFAVKEMGLHEWVTFQGTLPKQATMEAMKQADLLVKPSLSEGTPNVVLEAQYLGLPCIVTNWLGVEALITHKWNGWIVEKRNAEALANQIKEVLGLSIEEKEEIVANGQSIIREKFNSQVQKLAFHDLFKEAMNHE